MTKTLDIGCGDSPKNPFGAEEVYGIDINSSISNVLNIDLVLKPIPFPDSYFDFVTAYDFLEHIPRCIYDQGKRFNPFVNVMNEIYRVLKRGGVFLSFTPAYPKVAAFSDPTHVNIITEETMLYYFDERWLKAKIYGFYGAFRIEEQVWMKNHLQTVMRKP